MQAVILLAGYGSRLNRTDLPHKVLLPFGDSTLLSRHLSCLKEIKIEKVVLVLGHNMEAVKAYVDGLNMDLRIEFTNNPAYLTTGNTLSMAMGLRQAKGDTLILDGDVLYPPSNFEDYVLNSPASSFAITHVDVDDEECSKVLLNSAGTIHAFITKRHLTVEEKANYKFAGEAIGIFKLAAADVKKFLDLYHQKEVEYETTLWEIPFSEFARQVDLHPHFLSETGLFEIDTQEDYEQALAYFVKHPELY